MFVRRKTRRGASKGSTRRVDNVTVTRRVDNVLGPQCTRPAKSPSIVRHLGREESARSSPCSGSREARLTAEKHTAKQSAKLDSLFLSSTASSDSSIGCLDG
jgi:hypothetical protein